MLENHVLGTHAGPLTDEGYGVQLVAVCVGQAGFWSTQRAAFGQIAGRQFDDNNFVLQVKRGFTHNALRLGKA